MSSERARSFSVCSRRAKVSLPTRIARRDPTITALARSDPASSSVLADTLTRFRGITRQAGLDSAVAPVTIRR
jgi:hypothetical protein